MDNEIELEIDREARIVPSGDGGVADGRLLAGRRTEVRLHALHARTPNRPQMAGRIGDIETIQEQALCSRQRSDE